PRLCPAYTQEFHRISPERPRSRAGKNGGRLERRLAGACFRRVAASARCGITPFPADPITMARPRTACAADNAPDTGTPMIARASRVADVGHAARRALLAALLFVPGLGAAQLPSEVPSLAPMIERVSPAVVNISISGTISFPYGDDDPVFRRFRPDGDRPVQS